MKEKKGVFVKIEEDLWTKFRIRCLEKKISTSERIEELIKKEAA